MQPVNNPECSNSESSNPKSSNPKPCTHLKTKFTAKICLIAATAILLAACGKKETLAPSASTVLDATDAILAQAVIVDTTTAICKKTGGKTAAHAKASRQQWFESNWHWVDVADRHFSQRLKDKTFTYQDKPVALAALKLLVDAELQARKSLGSTGTHSSSRKRACTRKLTAIEMSIYNQEQTPEIISSLQFIEKNLASQSSTDAYRVPSLAGGLKPLDTPGRSYFSIEQRLIKEKCQNLQLFKLFTN